MYRLSKIKCLHSLLLSIQILCVLSHPGISSDYEAEQILGILGSRKNSANFVTRLTLTNINEMLCSLAYC